MYERNREGEQQVEWGRGQPGRQCQLYQLELLGGLWGWGIYPKRIITENKKEWTPRPGAETVPTPDSTCTCSFWPVLTFNIFNSEMCFRTERDLCWRALMDSCCDDIMQTGFARSPWLNSARPLISAMLDKPASHHIMTPWALSTL